MLDRKLDDVGPSYESQSYSKIIRDVIFAWCCSRPFFEGFTARRSKMTPQQPYHLPFLGVYIADEVMLPDGDWDVGHYAFIHDLKIAFSVQMENNDSVLLEDKIDQAFWEIMHICKDAYVMNMLDTFNPHTGQGNPGNTRIEGITRGHRRHNWGPSRSNNETPWMELQTEFTVRYRSYWAPVIDDTLDTIGVEIVPFHHGRIPPEDEIQQIIAKYEFKAQGTTDMETGEPVDEEES